MKTKMMIVLSSLVGAAAVHLALTACSTHPSVLVPGDPSRDARADTTTSCAQYEVQLVNQSAFDACRAQGAPDGCTATVQAPAGWEPMNVFGSTAYYRRCKP